MALVKCTECGHDMSDHAKLCPNCGFQNDSIICPECGTIISNDTESCTNCGYTLKLIQNNDIVVNDRGKNHSLAIISLIISICAPLIDLTIGTFFAFLTSAFSLTLGMIVLSANKNKKNDANTLAIIASIISLICLSITIAYFIITFFPRGI